MDVEDADGLEEIDDVFGNNITEGGEDGDGVFG